MAAALNDEIAHDLGIGGQVEIASKEVHIALVLSMQGGIAAEHGHFGGAAVKRDGASKEEGWLGDDFGLVDGRSIDLCPCGKPMLVVGDQSIDTNEFVSHQTNANGYNHDDGDAPNALTERSWRVGFGIRRVGGHVCGVPRAGGWQRTGPTPRVPEGAMATGPAKAVVGPLR